MARVVLTLLVLLLWAVDAPAQSSVRARLVAAADATRTLEKNAAGRRDPTRSDVRKYAQLRPWTLESSRTPRWPNDTDAAAIRALLSDADPAVRGLAIETLATLHEPSDVERIAQFLEDEAPSVPALGWNAPITAAMPSREGRIDSLRGWSAHSVNDYASAALLLMTGRSFDAITFAASRPRYSHGLTQAWYWNQRLERALQDASRTATTSAGAEALRRRVWREHREALMFQGPEVEAKGCLLAPANSGSCEGLRVTAERLLDLLERRNMWDDVYWDYDSNYGDTPYNRMVLRIARVTETYFGPEHLDRLREVTRQQRTFRADVYAALAIGISRLLPPAADADLDNTDLNNTVTRDGYLLNIFRTDPREEVKKDIARELLRIDARRHWPFLEPLFFAAASPPLKDSEFRYGVLNELGTAPRTAAKRTVLVAIVLDPRFDALFTMGHGRDRDRDEAVEAINAHAGREAITYPDRNALATPATAATALVKVRAAVAAALVAQPTARERLLTAANATRELVKHGGTSSSSASSFSPDIDLDAERMPRRFPLKADVPQYAVSRPWTRDYTIRYGDSLGLANALPPVQRWPEPGDGPALRALLTDPDATVRGLAVEALATLFDPRDLERIAALLNDDAPAVPALGWEQWQNSWSAPYERSNFDLVRSWYARRVSSYARVALRLMTGRNFTAASFATWHTSHAGGRADFWYWDIRLRQKLAERTADRESGTGYDGRRQIAIREIRAELRNEPPEVEAKACLLATQLYLSPCTGLRITSARLLDLLDRKNLWTDVAWDVDEEPFTLDGKGFARLVRGISVVTENYFEPSDIERLEAMLARESLFPHVKVGMQIAIARLLPPASEDNPARLDTRDGYLRRVVRSDAVDSLEAAVELIRINPRQHWPFLEPMFFARVEPFTQSPLRAAILDQLGAPPLTPEKRSILVAIVLDDRFKNLWTQPDKKGGDSRDRDAAARAVNAHAGREVLNVVLLQDLFLYGTTRSTAALEQVRAMVRNALTLP